MRLLSKATLLFISAAFCASASPINVDLSQIVYDVFPGEVVDVTAILQNTDTTDPIYLNGDALNVPESASSVDFFFANVPFLLNPSASTTTIELFSFVVSSGAMPGTYTGTYDLFGGVGNANQYNFDLVGSQTFSFFVAPEPSTMLLMGCGLMAFAGFSLRWRRARLK